MAGFTRDTISEVRSASLSDSDMEATIVNYMSTYLGFVHPPGVTY